MAIITTTETIPAYGDHRAQTLIRVTGETDYVRPKRLETPPAPKQAVPLTLDEARELLATETAKLADMDAEIKLITDRAAEVKIKLANAEKSLVATLAQNKQTMADYARGKADDKAVTQGQADVRRLEDLITGLKNVEGIVAADLEALKEPRKYQNERIVTSWHDRAWEAVAELEKKKAEPFLQRAHSAKMQSIRSRPVYGSGHAAYSESVAKTVIEELVKEYNLPPR